MLKGNNMYIVLNSKEAVEGMINGVTETIRLSGFSYLMDYRDDFRKAVWSIRAEYERLPNRGKRDEWKTALKRRRKEVGKIITQILDVSHSGQIANPVIRVTRSRIYFFNGIDVEHEGIHPGSCWSAYRLFRYASCVSNAVELKAVLQGISTIFQIAKDLRLSPEERDEDVLQQIEEISTLNEVPEETKEKWSQRLDELLELITQGVEGKQGTDQYPFLRKFVASIKLVRQKESIRFQLSPENLKLSNASSGARVHGESLPGYLGSLFEMDLDPEFDYSKFDMLTGYQSGLSGRVAPSSVTQKRNYCVAIEQHKDAMRLIHVLANQFHDRLTYFEHYHKSLMLVYSSDDLFRQLEGRYQIKRWLRNPRIRAVYSLDLHAATNTLSLEWQDKVNRYFFKWLGFEDSEIETLAEVWLRIMTFDSEIVLPTSKKKVRFKFASGQPMGFTDSFFSFSLLHHIVILCVSKCLWDEGHRLGDYRVVGDDSVVAFQSDKDLLYPHLYKECMGFLNTQCELDKGYIFNQDQPDYLIRVAEFCKFLICAGEDVTPIPLGALAQATTAPGRLTLLSWLALHDRENLRLTPKRVAIFCGCSNEETIAIYLLARIPIKNILHSESSPLNISNLMRVEESKLLVAASISFLKQALILELLIEVNRDEDYIPKYSDYTSFKRKHRRLISEWMSHPEENNLYENKFYKEYFNLELKAIALGIGCEEILKGLIPSSDILDIIPILNRWDEASLNDLLKLVSLWNDLTIVGEEESTLELSDADCSVILNSVQRISHYDVSSNNHRFYTRVNKITRGLDLSKIYTDTLDNMKLLGIDRSELDNLIIQMDGEYSEEENTIEDLWPTEVISDDYDESSPENEDDEEFDPWSLLD